MRECYICGESFLPTYFGQGPCRACERIETSENDHYEKQHGLWLETSTCIEDCRDKAEDALALLDKPRLQGRDKATLRKLVDSIRVTAADGGPEEP